MAKTRAEAGEEVGAALEDAPTKAGKKPIREPKPEGEPEEEVECIWVGQ
ncbi:MAG: hypothetical protein HQL53_03785 [Magnetococcales bacterium]|nr:hypothetical protein [Magnetococcales bacterium]